VRSYVNDSDSKYRRPKTGVVALCSYAALHCMYGVPVPVHARPCYRPTVIPRFGKSTMCLYRGVAAPRPRTSGRLQQTPTGSESAEDACQQPQAMVGPSVVTEDGRAGPCCASLITCRCWTAGRQEARRSLWTAGRQDYEVMVSAVCVRTTYLHTPPVVCVRYNGVELR
jgi:hypothetical protein